MHGEPSIKFTSFLQQFHYTYHQQSTADSLLGHLTGKTAFLVKGKQNPHHRTSMKYLHIACLRDLLAAENLSAKNR